MKGLEATVDVIEDGETWIMVMKAPGAMFEEREPLPERFKEMEPVRQKYWSEKTFKKLEKKLSSRIKALRSIAAQRKVKANTAKPLK